MVLDKDGVIKDWVTRFGPFLRDYKDQTILVPIAKPERLIDVV
jgi:hypothetical protein